MVTFGFNLLASLAMAIILGPATLAGGSDLDRMRYIADNRLAVQLGWTAWIGATLSLVLFFHTMMDVLAAEQRRLLRFAFTLAAIGAAPDCLADLMALGVVPDLAERYLAALSNGQTELAGVLLEQFRTWDRFSVLCTGGLGNTCYGLAGCLLTFALFRSGELNRPLRLLAFPLWAFTFFMSYGSFTLSASILPVAVGTTMSIFLVWAFWIGVTLFQRSRA
ncbi:MAG: hypothetical protein KDK30_11130 [Leptospiraceae bacterium]|nr:hypothetical protein [Leptospiraceae bacterium]